MLFHVPNGCTQLMGHEFILQPATRSGDLCRVLHQPPFLFVMKIDGLHRPDE